MILTEKVDQMITNKQKSIYNEQVLPITQADSAYLSGC